MGRHKKVPKRRFAGFAGEWEERKFEDLLNQHDGIRRGPFGSALKKEFFVKESDYVVYEQHNAIYDNYETRYNITKEKFEELRKFQLNEGDFILSGAGTIGKISRVPKGIKPGVFNQALVRIKIDTNVMDSEYFLQWIRSDDMQRKLTDSNPGSAMVNLVPMSEVKNWDVLIPSIPEQQKIGNFFKQLDEQISLQQCKLEKTKSLKSAYLAEMFPAEGERVPKRRFEGFTDEWEKCELQELCDVFDDGDWIESKDQSNDGIRLIQTGNIGLTEFLNKENSKKWISKATFKRLNCNEVFPGDIIISRLPEPAGRACIIPDLGVRMITSVDCTIVRTKDKVSSDFLVQFLATSNYFKIVDRLLGGGTRQRISRSYLATIKVPLPKTLEEQQKIGNFFKQLDDKISIEQRKLDKLKALKQAYLHEMFV